MIPVLDRLRPLPIVLPLGKNQCLGLVEDWKRDISVLFHGLLLPVGFG